MLDMVLEKLLLLFVLLLHSAIGEDFHELVHGVRYPQERYEEEHKCLFACLGRRWG